VVHQAELEVVAQVCPVALAEGQVVPVATRHSALRPVRRGGAGPSGRARVSR
jgi:hypothetical protein